jgi:hypothetical protein
MFYFIFYPLVPLCSWCGTWKGDKLCGSCKTTRYCSVKHQVLEVYLLFKHLYFSIICTLYVFNFHSLCIGDQGIEMIAVRLHLYKLPKLLRIMFQHYHLIRKVTKTCMKLFCLHFPFKFWRGFFPLFFSFLF